MPTFKTIFLAVPPLYVPEKVRLESPAVKLAKFEPKEIPEIVELVSPVLSSVPVIVGLNINAPAVGIIVCPKVSPLNAVVDVENAMVFWVVVAYPEPKDINFASSVD